MFCENNLPKNCQILCINFYAIKSSSTSESHAHDCNMTAPVVLDSMHIASPVNQAISRILFSDV